MAREPQRLFEICGRCCGRMVRMRMEKANNIQPAIPRVSLHLDQFGWIDVIPVFLVVLDVYPDRQAAFLHPAPKPPNDARLTNVQAESFGSMAIRLSATLGARASIGSCSSHSAKPRPVFGTLGPDVLIAFGVVVAGPRNINCVNGAS